MSYENHLFIILLWICAIFAGFISSNCWKISNAIRIGLVKHIFKKCGKITTINRLAYFGSGRDIEIGDYSGIGAKCVIPKIR